MDTSSITKVDTIFHGGTVVSSSGSYQASVAIKGEKIVAVGIDKSLPPADRYIDITGNYLLPGAIDCHVHIREPDNWRVGSIAAAYAGITTIISFVSYQRDNEETLPSAIRRLTEEAERESLLDFGFHFVIGHTPYILNSIPEAIRMGVSSYKMFMTYDFRSPDSWIAKVMEVVGANDGMVQLHAENGEVIEYLTNKAIADGRTHPRDFPATCPVWAEEEAINRGILLGKMTDCPTYIVHLSSHAGLERIKEAQRQGQPLWTETCPQYLLLDETEMERLGPLAKIGPPLRPADGVNQQALWRGTEDGFISCIGSDHSPSSPEMQSEGWKNIFLTPEGTVVPFGAPSLETLVPLVYSEGVAKRKLPIEWMARVLSENPARIFGIYPQKGVIRPGSDADFLVIDPGADRSIRAQELHGSLGYTPYEGWQVHGQFLLTMQRGKIILKDGRLQQTSGSGRFLHAGSPMPPLGGSVR